MAIKFTSLLAQRSGSMYKERVGERGSSHAQASHKEELDLKIYNTTMAFEQSWQIKHDGGNASKLTADFNAQELESTFPLAKFSEETRFEKKISVGDLSGTNPEIIAEASAVNAAYLELNSIFKAEQDATSPKVSIYDVDVIIGSANAQTGSKRLTAELDAYSFDASSSFIAGKSGAYILSLDSTKATLQSSLEAELKNLSSNQSLQLGVDAELKIEEAAYRITDKLSAAEIYKVSPRTAVSEPLFETNGNFIFTIEGTGNGDGVFQTEGGGTDKHLLNIMQDGIVASGAHFSVERDPMGAGGPVTSMSIFTNQYSSQVHQSYIIQQQVGMAQGQFRIEGDIGSTQFNGAPGQSDMLFQQTGAASGKHHIRLSNAGVDIGQKLTVQGDAGFAMELMVVDKITGFGDLEISQNASIGGNLTVTGDLTVNGSTVEVQGTQVSFEDTIFDMGQDNATNVLNASLDLGFMMNYEDAGVAKKSSIYWDTSEKKFKLAAEASENNGIITSSLPAELEVGRLEGASADLDLLRSDEIRLGKGAASFANAEIGLKIDPAAPGSAEFKVSSLLHADEAASSINLMADNQSIQGATAAGKLNFEQIEVSINETTQSAWTWYDGQGASKASILEIGGKILVGDVSSEFEKDLSVGGPLTNGASIAAPIFSVDGSAYVKQDLEVDGVLYAASASFAQSDFQSLEADLLHLESDEVRFIMAEPEDALVADMASAAVEHFSVILPGAAAALGRTAEIKSSLPLNLDAAADIQGDLNLQSKLDVAGKASFTDTVDIDLKLTASDDVDLSAAGKLTDIKGKLNVAEDAAFSSKVDITGKLTASSDLLVAADSSLSGDVAMGANATVAGKLVASGEIIGQTHITAQGDLNATNVNATVDILSGADIVSGQDIYVKRDLIPGDKAGDAGAQSIGQSTKPFETAYISSLVADDSTLSADLTVGGDVDIAGKLNVQGNSTVSNLAASGDISTTQGLSVTKTASIGSDLSVGAQLSVTGDALIGGDATITGDAQANNLTATVDGAIGNDLSVGNDASIGGDLTVTGDGQFNNLNATVSASTNQLTVGADASIGQDLSVARDLSVGRDSVLTGKLTVSGDSDLQGLKVNANSQYVGDAQFDNALNGSSLTARFEWGGPASGSQAAQPGYNFHVAPAANFAGDVHIDQDLTVGGTLNGNNVNITGNFQNHIDIEQPYAVRWRDSANSGIAGFLQGQDNRILAKSTDFDFSFSLEGMDGGLTSNLQAHAPAVTPAVAFKAFDLGTITDSGWEPAQAHSAGTAAAKWMITCRANEAISGTDAMNSRTSALAQGMQYKLNKEDPTVAYQKGKVVYLSTIVAGAVCQDLPQNEGDHVVIVGKVIEDSSNVSPIVYVAISMHYMYRI